MRILLIVLFTSFLAAQTGNYAYKMILYQAAPGQLTDLITAIKKDINNHTSYGLEEPVLMRHSQGAHWDLMLVIPIESMQSYFSESAMQKRKSANSFDPVYGSDFLNMVSHYEEIYANGPDAKGFNKLAAELPYYHIEMFVAVAGKQKELLKERQMENDYYRNVDFGTNYIFKKITGSKWQNITIGFYKDIKDFAKSVDIPFDVDDEAAKKAGFKGVAYIGTYLRELLLTHQDTLAKRVN